MDNARRLFLRGKFSTASAHPAPRPPWAIEDPTRFLQTCTRCSECVSVCPTTILKMGDGGYPEVSFASNGCDVCGQCADVCQPQALQRKPHALAWSWRAHISKACLAQQQVECRVCGEFCDARAIRFKPQLGGVSMPEVQRDLCTGCGHCVSKCPTQAIAMKTPDRQ
jgi:ferredoxin-type protein NapF